MMPNLFLKEGSNELLTYKSYNVNNFRNIPQVIDYLTEEEKFSIEVVSAVLPFKTNNYVIDNLIDWNNFENDPMYNLTFPNFRMLNPEHYNMIAQLLINGADKEIIKSEADRIRLELNPHPAGQKDYNIPEIAGNKLEGVQHKYDHTALFFPKQSHTCHAYCTFCFRWPQFVNIDEFKFSAKEIDYLFDYFKHHPELTDILFTGGDPMIMSSKIFAKYIDAIIEADIPNLQNIRIGTKAIAYWPYKFFDENSYYILNSFQKAVENGYHVSIMAHFNHYRELETDEARKAVELINQTGAKIRSQSPVLRHINDNPKIWTRMWKEQVRLGIIPYYMFIARDTGAKDYFAVPLVRAWKIFREAYQDVSGLARTVRGPSMSCDSGKIQVLGVSDIKNEKVIVLRFLQGRNKDWIHKPFFAEFDNKATWIDELKPAFGEEKFFYEDELNEFYQLMKADNVKIDEYSFN